MKGIRNELCQVTGIPALLLAMAAPALAQSTCKVSVASTAPVPSATALAGFQDLLQSPVRVAADNLGRTYVTDSSAGRVFVRDDCRGKVEGSGLGIYKGLNIVFDPACHSL